MTTRKQSVSISVPRLLLKYATDRGIKTDEICQEFGLDTTRLENPEGTMPLDQFNALWELVAQRDGDPNFGLHFGEAVPGFAGGHILYAVMMNCKTLGEALDRFCRYHGLLADGSRPRLDDDGDNLVFTCNPLPTPGKHYAEAILSMLSLTLRRLTDNRVLPAEVRFAHQQPPDISEHQRIFGILPLFGQLRDGLAIKQQDRFTPVFLANPSLLTALDQYVQHQLEHLPPSDSWVNRTSDTVYQLLLRGEKPRLQEIARTLSISPRHLQNKLQAEGASYQTLLDSTRRQIALDYLGQTEVTLCEIAFLLGFSEQSAFNHAFRRWTGTTPMDFKAALASSHNQN